MNWILQLVLASILGANPPLPPNVTLFNGMIRDTTGNPVATGDVAFTLKPGVDTTTSGNARFTPTTVVCEMEAPAIVSYIGNGVTTTVTVAISEPWLVGDAAIITGTGTVLDTSAAATYAIATTGVGGTQFTFLSNFTGSGTGGFMGGLFSPTGTGPCTVVQNTSLNPAGTSYRIDIQPNGTTTSSFGTYAIGPGPIDISTIVATPSQQPAYSFVDMFTNGQQISGLKNFTNPGNTYQGGTFNSPTINNAILNAITATNWILISPTIQQPNFTTQPITLGGSNNYSISWTNPTAPRSLAIPDPGGNDIFVFQQATQNLYNKSLLSPVLQNATFNTKPISNNANALVGNYGIASIVAQLNLTLQTGSIPTTTLFSYSESSGADLLLVNWYLDTTQAGSAGTVTVTFNWGSCYTGLSGQAQTITSSSVSLTSNGAFQQGSIVVCSTSPNIITYSTTVAGATGGPTYALNVKVAAE